MPYEYRSGIGTCKHPGCPSVWRDEECLVVGREVFPGVKVWCPVHPLAGIRWAVITGSHNPDAACTESCRTARSPFCSCSCAGTCHGAAFSAGPGNEFSGRFPS